MPTQRHILVVSGSRADYALLYWPMRLLAADSSFRLSVAATGMHLAREFGHTVDQFARDGFPLAAQVPVLGEDDDPAEMARAIGRGILGFVDVIEKLKPDMLLVLGDRFEILAAAEAAFVQRVPIVHLCGGDVTNGALDDGFRHALTKMASLHFVTNDAAARRVRQLGEMPERIFNVGSTGIDFIKQANHPDRAALSVTLGYEIPQRYLLVTFHPVTLDPVPSVAQMGELLAALGALPPDIGLIFTYANADAEGIALNDLIRGFVTTRGGARAHASLAPLAFQSLMKHAAAIVGNSSSGLYEAPSFDVPSVNIGRRQEGRPRAASVIDCAPARAAIGAAIDRALALQLHDTVNPYGDGEASKRIVATLRGLADWPGLVFKEFRDQSA
jgi:UDP-hydrolysing UDP-N-acetyl-D-glucosamine 2-epimerase